jgi:RHS repeat-associated protein
VRAAPTGVPVSIDLGDVRVDLLAGQHRYRHLDFRGNVKFVSDQQGEIQSHYHYDAYGLRQVFGSNDDPVRFAGRIQLGELVVMDARIYDPAGGRFLSPDPVLQDLNQYAYTLGNPIWFADPSGRDFEAVLEGVVATAGVALATVSLFTVTSAGVAVLAGASFGLAGLGFALWVAHRLEGVAGGGSGALFAGSGGAGSGRGGADTGSVQSCSPTRLASVPGLGWLHWVLIAVQILLAPLLIRSWSARTPRRSR